MRKVPRIAILLGSAAMSPTMSSIAYAQNSTEEDAGNDIVVTARRIDERLQDVPISITAFSQEALTRQNIFSAKDLANYTPSLSANARYGADFASFSIRGFTQEARTTASVGVYFADAPVPRSAGSVSGDGAAPGTMFDLENVQVLKGPQGTLFGRNTTGGAVLLVPKRPTDEMGGYIEGSIGNYSMHRLQAVLNLPAGDSLRFRAGVDWQKRDGYVKNISPVGPKDFSNIDYAAARFSMVVDITPDLDNYTVFNYSESNTNGAASKITDCYNGTGSLTCQQLIREQGQDPHTASTWLPWQYQNSKVWEVVNQTKWTASDSLTVKNTMSYGRVTQDQALDLFGVLIPITSPFRVGSSTVMVPAGFVGNVSGSDTTISAPGYHAADQTTFSEELQFQGRAADGRLRWQAGAYYERSAPKDWVGTSSMGNVVCASEAQWASFSCTDLTALVGGQIPSGYGSISANARETGSRNRNLIKINYRNVGLYAQGSFDIIPALTLDAGFRYTWDKSWGAGSLTSVAYSGATNPAWAVPTFSCVDPSRTYAGSVESCSLPVSQTSSAPTWLLGLSYKPVQDIMLYAKYSRGYRQGSINPNAALGFQTYKPEKVDVYEAGIKSSFHGALAGTFNISGFYNEFSNMQLQVAFLDVNNIPPNLAPSPAIVNAGKSRIYGVEIEASVIPVAGLTLQANYAYLNTKLTQFTNPDLSGQPAGYYNLVAGGPTQGKRLQYTPDHKLTIGASYRLPLAEELGKVTLGATYIYTGKIYYGETSVANRTLSIFAPGDPNYDPTVAPGYSLLNLNVSWDRIGNSGLSASAFMTNATDKVYYDSRSLSGSRGFVNRYVGEPRMYGMRLRYEF